MIKYFFIVNPIAGGNDKTSFYDFIEEDVIPAEFTYDIYTTTGDDDEFKLKKLVKKLKPEVVVAIGGDGTLHLAARVVKKTSIKIGLMPFGSANGMARELSIPKVPDITISLIPSERYSECWEIIREEQVRKIDLVRINKKHYSIHLSDIGLNAKIVKRFEEERIRGYFGYARLFIKELKQKRRISYQLIANGKRYKGKGYMIVIANATMYGTGSVINPVGKLDDGEFEICIVRQIKIVSLLRSMLTIFRINLRKRDDLMKVYSCKNASIELKQMETLQIDGEVIGETRKLDIRIIPQAINMITPNL